MPLYGYARVSTRDQDLALQLNELTAAGCAKVFKEKASGARSDRPELAKVISRLESGDVLVVTRLDRLVRSTRDLLNVLDELAKRGAGFRSLKDAWADTTTPHGKLMVTVLGGLAASIRPPSAAWQLPALSSTARPGSALRPRSPGAFPASARGLLTPHRLSSEGDTMNIRLPAATEHPGTYGADGVAARAPWLSDLPGFF